MVTQKVEQVAQWLNGSWFKSRPVPSHSVVVFLGNPLKTWFLKMWKFWNKSPRSRNNSVENAKCQNVKSSKNSAMKLKTLHLDKIQSVGFLLHCVWRFLSYCRFCWNLIFEFVTFVFYLLHSLLCCSANVYLSDEQFHHRLNNKKRESWLWKKFVIQHFFFSWKFTLIIFRLDFQSSQQPFKHC